MGKEFVITQDAFRLHRQECQTAGHERKELQLLLGKALNISNGSSPTTSNFKDLNQVWAPPDQTCKAEIVCSIWGTERPWTGNRKL